MRESGFNQRKFTAAAIGLIAVAVIVIYLYANPVESGYAPRCFFKVVSGYDCPGCGSQRALSALLHCRIGEAWHYNPFLFFAVPVGVLYMVVEFAPERYKRLHSALMSVPAAMVLVAAILIWWIVRNLVWNGL